ncbi:aKG-HExxH-type peptide beta-hydroxylase [Paracoccus sp. NGMCC 1.201697]|uniref:AKG-HExxH-type peptide beta-hydroxylase n=1 Tax=Paracoccus broussonetiae subsp. drimophilus TaxID=3373869 RepID=A0ABW7LQB6_9RHOB
MASLFLPDPAGMLRLQADLHDRLHLSLTHLLTEVIPPEPDEVAAITEGLGRLRAQFPEPALFALHMALRDSLLAENAEAFALARRRFAAWDFRDHPSPGPVVSPLAADRLGSARAELIARALADDVGLTTSLTAPPPEATEAMAATIARADALLALASPDWRAELRLLVSEVFLAVNGGADGRQGFAGGSSFDLFGAILMNPLHRNDLAHVLMTLIHESSHLRLFCWHLDDEVVLNGPEETFRSPLRKQPRPMEGVFHATWVSARMAVCGRAVLSTAGNALSEDEALRLGKDVDQALATFRDGLGIVREHGRLTAQGARLVADASDAVEDAALERVRAG